MADLPLPPFSTLLICKEEDVNVAVLLLSLSSLVALSFHSFPQSLLTRPQVKISPVDWIKNGGLFLFLVCSIKQSSSCISTQGPCPFHSAYRAPNTSRTLTGKPDLSFYSPSDPSRNGERGREEPLKRTGVKIH